MWCDGILEYSHHLQFGFIPKSKLLNLSAVVCTGMVEEGTRQFSNFFIFTF